jgi:hypothetical protein
MPDNLNAAARRRALKQRDKSDTKLSPIDAAKKLYKTYKEGRAREKEMFKDKKETK